MIDYSLPEFLVDRDLNRCIQCGVCVRQCANEVHAFAPNDPKKMIVDERKCVNCQRCVTLCPTHALSIRKHPNQMRESANWRPELIKEIFKQADTVYFFNSHIIGNDRKKSFNSFSRIPFISICWIYNYIDNINLIN